MSRAGPLATLLAAVAPPRCGACGGACGPGEALCAACAVEIRGARPSVVAGPPGLDLAVSAVPYEGSARLLAHGLKYGRRTRLAAVAASAMLEACPARELEGVVVPVPAAPWRGRWRGFDPAEEIALALARSAGLHYGPCLRRGLGPRQVGRPRSERLANPPGIALRAGTPAPRSVLLVDDVHTTGATLEACARALRAGGAGRVVALVFARSRARGRPAGRPLGRP